MDPGDLESIGRLFRDLAGLLSAHCYAMLLAARLAKMGVARYEGLTQEVNGHPVWTGEVRLANEVFRKPLQWKKPRRVFVNSMSDLFHKSVSIASIDQIFGMMALCWQHSFQILTKRADQMHCYMTLPSIAEDVHQAACRIAQSIDYASHSRNIWPLPNVWLGVSVENRRMRWRIDELRQTPAAVRFLSCEPLLEDLGELNLEGIHWVIVGGESGPQRRPMRLEWLESIVSQCDAAKIPVFVKQGNAMRPGQQGDIPDYLFARKEMPA